MTRRQKISRFLVLAVLFFLPFQTRWIFRDLTLGGDVWEYGRLSMYATEVLILAAVLLRGRVWLSDRIQPLVRPFLLLFGALLLSAAWSRNVTLALGQLEHVLAALALLTLVADERTDLRASVRAFALGLAVPCALAWWQVLAGTSPASSWLGLAAHDAATLGASVVETSGGRLLRAYGTFPHPNVFGGYLAVAWAACAWLASRAEGREEAIVASVSAVVLPSTLVLTFSRSAWIAVLAAAFCLLFSSVLTRTRPSRPLLAFLVLSSLSAFAALAAFYPAFSSRLDSSSRLEARSVDERVSGYAEWLDVVQIDPVAGTGPGNYTLALASVFPGRPAYAYQPVHNAPLLFFAETGFLGLFGLVQIIRAAARFFRPSSGPRKPDGWSAVSPLAVLLVVACLDHYLWSLWPGLVLCALAFGFALRRFCREHAV